MESPIGRGDAVFPFGGLASGTRRLGQLVGSVGLLSLELQELVRHSTVLRGDAVLPRGGELLLRARTHAVLTRVGGIVFLLTTARVDRTRETGGVRLLGVAVGVHRSWPSWVIDG